MTPTQQIHTPADALGQAKARTAVFFGGVVPASPDEERLAEEVGIALAAQGFTLLHGGYNGLMEAAARGAAAKGGKVCAVTLAGKAEWGPFNSYVTEAVHLKSPGERLDHYLDAADLVVAMGGGVGTLHELTAAIYYAGNIRRIPVWLVGLPALRLLTFLRKEKWLFESPTRPLGFLAPIASATVFATKLHGLPSASKGEA